MNPLRIFQYVYFLKGNSAIPRDQVFAILLRSANMMTEKSLESKIQEEDFEADIRTEGKFLFMGALYGQKFDALVATPTGDLKMSYLLRENAQVYNGVPVNLN
jgi:hypothetical protein